MKRKMALLFWRLACWTLVMSFVSAPTNSRSRVRHHYAPPGCSLILRFVGGLRNGLLSWPPVAPHYAPPV